MIDPVIKQLTDEALKLDSDQHHLAAVGKYLEALNCLNKSLLDLCHQRDVRLGKKDFGNHVRLASNCLSRVCAIHELFKKSILDQEVNTGSSKNGLSSAAAPSTLPECSCPGNGRYSTDVGQNDPVDVAIDYNRRLVSQFDETVRRRRQQSGGQPMTGDLEQKLSLQRKQIENLYLAKRDSKQVNPQDALGQQTWSPRSKADKSHRIRDRSQSEQRISAWAPVDLANGSWVDKYLRLLAVDEDMDPRGYENYSRLPTLEEHFGPQVAGTMSREERKRQAAIIEFMFTEQTHLRNLKILQTLFKLPLSERQILPANFVFPYLRMTLMELLFGNLDEVVQVHGELTNTFKPIIASRSPVTNFGQVMMQFFAGPNAERFKTIVSKFCRHQQYAIDQLAVRRKRDERFATFLQEIESLRVCRGLQLGAMLPMETQRVAKYHLMFRHSLDYEPKSTEQFQQLERCYTTAKEIAEFVNAEKRNFESVHKLAELQHRLESAGCAQTETGFTLQGRSFIHEGSLRLKMGNHTVELHCVILDGYFLLLMNSSDGYGLLIASLSEARQSITYRSFDARWNPVVRLSSAGIRDDKERSFYLIAGLDGDFQVYHLEANRDTEKAKWLSLLNEEISKSSGTKNHLVPGTSSINNIQRSLEQVEYTSDADFADFSDDEDEVNDVNGDGKRCNGSS